MFPGPTELILILIVAVLVFGPRRIPEIMQSLGQGIRTFKRSMEGEDIPQSSSALEQNTPADQPNTSLPGEVPPREKTGL